MHIDHDKKIVLIHPRKTAGTSIAQALELPDDETKHARYTELFDAVGADAWDDYFIICTIRNPYTTIVSDYHFNHYLYDIGKRNNLNEWAKKHTVNNFVQIRHDKAFFVIRDDAGEIALRPDRHLYCPKRGRIKVDLWIKQEELADGMQAVAKRFGLHLPETMPHRHKMTHAGVDELNERSKELMRTSSRAVFEVFYPELL